jgi:GH25 family lysozyme M1 (1,4-beta-N-acetylmuramidase)
MTAPRRDGIDVSHYQGVVDWVKAVAAGIFWVAFKFTQGTGYVDPTAIGNRLNARNAAARYRFAYHWLSPAPLLARLIPAARQANARSQAAFFLATIGTLDIGEGVLLDAEEAGITVDMAIAWCEAVEAVTGRPVAVYCGVYTIGGALWHSTELFNGKRPRVLAGYVSEDRMLAAAAPFQPDAWQYSSASTVVPGVAPARCDEDMVYNRDIFDVACGYAVAPPPPPPAPAPAPGQNWGLYPLNPRKPIIRQGSTDKSTAGHVSYCQGVLHKVGFYVAGVDGLFGPVTTLAVKRYQTARHLTVDGVVGPQTWASIDRDAAA